MVSTTIRIPRISSNSLYCVLPVDGLTYETGLVKSVTKFVSLSTDPSSRYHPYSGTKVS